MIGRLREAAEGGAQHERRAPAPARGRRRHPRRGHDEGRGPGARRPRPSPLDTERRECSGEADALRAERKQLSERSARPCKSGRGRRGSPTCAAESSSWATASTRERRAAARSSRPSSTSCCCASPTRPTPTCRSAAPTETTTVREWGEPHRARRRRLGRASRTGRSPRRWACSTSRPAPRSSGTGFPLYRGAGAASSAR